MTKPRDPNAPFNSTPTRIMDPGYVEPRLSLEVVPEPIHDDETPVRPMGIHDEVSVDERMACADTEELANYLENLAADLMAFAPKRRAIVIESIGLLMSFGGVEQLDAHDHLVMRRDAEIGRTFRAAHERGVARVKTNPGPS